MSFALTWNSFLDSLKMETPLQKAMCDMATEIEDGTSPLLKEEPKEDSINIRYQKIPFLPQDIYLIPYYLSEDDDNQDAPACFRAGKGDYPNIIDVVKYACFYKGVMFAYFHIVTRQYDNGKVIGYDVGEQCVDQDRWPHMDTEDLVEAAKMITDIRDRAKEYLDRHIHTHRHTTLSFLDRWNYPDEIVEYVKSKVGKSGFSS